MPKDTYRVVSDTSTRASADPDSPRYEEWLHWAAGDTATSWPKHTPVAQWVASGHWVPVTEPADTAPEPKEVES